MRVVTKQEEKVRKAYHALNIPILTEQVFCFRCGCHWKSDNERPEACAICGYVYDDYGQFCKPDIMLKTEVSYLGGPPPHGSCKTVNLLGVIRIDDENLHKKNKKHRMHDFNQTEQLEKRGTKVFILYNEEVDDYYPWRLYAIAEFFWKCLTHEKLYKLYRSDKDIIQRFAR